MPIYNFICLRDKVLLSDHVSDLPVWFSFKLWGKPVLQAPKPCDKKGLWHLTELNGCLCGTSFYVPDSGFIKYWLQWKPLLRAQGPQTKSQYFKGFAFKRYLTQKKKTTTFQSLVFPCHLLKPKLLTNKYEKHELNFPGYIITHSSSSYLSSNVFWCSKNNELLHVFILLLFTWNDGCK